MKRQNFSKLSIFIIAIFSFATVTCNSTAGLPNPFITNTPSPTTTPTPTNTLSPTPTLTPTSTATPRPSGSVKELQPDGTTRFTDYDNNFEIVFPSGWTAISLNADDINALLELVSKNNPDLEDTILALKSMDPKIYRIFAIDFRRDHIVNGYTANISVIAQSNSLINDMSLQNVVDTTAQALPQFSKSVKVLSSKVTTTAANIPIGVIEANNSFVGNGQSKIQVYQQVVLLKMPEVLVSITLTVPPSKKAILIPEFKAVIDSLKLLEQ